MTLYYIFTADEAEHQLAYGFRYSVVDMTLNGGLGDVTDKNVLLHADGTEKLTSTLAINGKDFWIITKAHQDVFNVFRMDCNGISSQPIVSHAGTSYFASGNYADAVGCLKVSPDGKKLATTLPTKSGWEIFDFDNATGIVSNAIRITLSQGTNYGVEFSPNSELVYIASESTSISGAIFQYRIYPYDQTSIQNSRYRVDSSLLNKASLQMGMDGKIYSANVRDSSLNVISNPNVYGPGCGFLRREVHTEPGYVHRGLPAFDNSKNIEYSQGNYPGRKFWQ